jgi:two-component system, cell cycle sensor histidine kinase and response regulator CckA
MELAHRQRMPFRTATPGSMERDPARQRGDDHALPKAWDPSLHTFAGGLAHNFNNLLTVILGYTALMKDQVPADSTLADMVHQIEAAAHRGENVIRQMLLFTGKYEPFFQLLDLSTLTQELESRFQACLAGHVGLEYDLSPDLPAVLGDQVQLRRVITSLFFNAAEAIGEQPGVIRLRTRAVHANRAFLALNDQEVPQLTEGQYVWLQVSDSGCGMDEEMRRHIFEPFFSTKFIGRGLGLSAALGIVRQHRGVIWVASRPGRGTIVNILLPRANPV